MAEPDLQQWFKEEAYGSMNALGLRKFHWNQAWQSYDRKVKLGVLGRKSVENLA